MLSPDILPEDHKIIAVVNPVASNTMHQGDLSKLVLGSLAMDYLDKIKLIKTEQDDELTAEKIAKTLKPGDIIVPFGGDGTFGAVASALRMPGLDEELRDTIVVPWLFGNANLVAQELIKPIDGVRPSLLDVLAYGKVVDIWGAELTVESPSLDEPEEWLAMACHGIGASGNVAHALNDVRHKKLRAYRLTRDLIDGNAGRKGIKASPIINLEIDGQEVEAIGSIGVSTDRYVKYIKTPSSVGERAFHETTLLSNSMRYLAGRITAYTSGNLEWRKVQGDESIVYRVVSQPGQQLSIDVDAERRLLPSDPNEEVESVVTVKPSSTKLRVATTNQAIIDQQSSL